MKHIQALLKLDNVEIMNSFTDKIDVNFDVLTSRALLSLKDILYYKKNVKRILLFKGQDYQKEIKSLNDSKVMHNISVYNAYNDDSFFLRG